MTISAYTSDLPSLDSVNYTLGLLGIAAIIVGWWRGWWESPKRRAQREREEQQAARSAEVHAAIMGAGEKRDLSGAVTQPKQPGLVALQRADSERLAKVEEAVVEFRHMTGLLTEVLGEVDEIKQRVSALEDQNVKDIIIAAERAATAAVASDALRLIRDRDVTDGDSTEPSGELD